MGTPRASVTTERLVPSFPRSVGLGPVFFPTQGSFGHRSIGRQPLPIDPDKSIIGQQPLPSKFIEHTGLDPFREAPVSRGLRADPGGAQRTPLTTGAQDEENAVQGGAIRDARIVASQRMARPGRQQRRHLLPQSIWNSPATVLNHLPHRSPPKLFGSEDSTITAPKSPYWDRL